MTKFYNPILPGFRPDPSICRVDDDFFLVTSSFEYFPGLPIHHSRDLVHWRLLGHVLVRESQLNLRGIKSSGGLYAPTLRYHRGRFFVVCTHVGGGGNFLVTSRRPEGPYSDPIWLDEEGIDPSLFFDGDRIYYTRTGIGTDFNHPFIYQGELDPKTFRPCTSMRVIWQGMGGVWPEGPHVYRRGKTYWLIAAEGGTGYDHSQMAARSAHPYGPFEPCPHNPILTHRRRKNHPIQATGHMDWVTLPDGSTWAVLLGIRPQGGRHHHLGRETFLTPVIFDEDGWPVVGQKGAVELQVSRPQLPSHPWERKQLRHVFDGVPLGPEWLYLRNPPERAISLQERPGYLRLWGVAGTLDGLDPVAFVGKRQTDFSFSAACALEFQPTRSGEEAGITLRAREDFHLDLALRHAGKKSEIILRKVQGKSARIVARKPVPSPRIRLEIKADPTTYRFFCNHLLLGQIPTRALSAETMGRQGILHFTGTVIGLYATGGGAPASNPADFRFFAYRPTGNSKSPLRPR